MAALSSLGAVFLGLLASIALVRRRFRGKAAVSALLLSAARDPVRGLRDLAADPVPHDRHPADDPHRVIGHIVICLPYTILVLVPRLDQIDVSLEEASMDLARAGSGPTGR